MANRAQRTQNQKNKKLTPKAREVFSVRFSPEELDRLRREAEARGGTLAGTVRKIVMDSLGQERARMITMGANTTTHAHSSIRVHGLIVPNGESRNAA